MVDKQDSNAVGLRIAAEVTGTPKTLPGSPVWVPYEPNSFSDFGAQITTVSRNPINDSRQRRRGVVTDLAASAGFNIDLTQTNVQDLMQSFFYADFRRKGEEVPTAATASTDLFDLASTAGFVVGSLIFVTGFSDAANNGFMRVTAVVTNTTIAVDASLVTDAAPGSDVNIVVVGFEGTAGDLDVDDSGTFPAIDSTSIDFTTLGLIPGESIFVGGDAAIDKFTTAANNGFARIRSIAANVLTLDKAEGTMVTEASSSETIQLFFGRVLKDEADRDDRVFRTNQLERTLGEDDDGTQSEYVTGAFGASWQLNVPSADKVTVDLAFTGLDHETRTGDTDVKSGTRPALVQAESYNTSSDFSRIKMSLVSGSDENITALFAFMSDLTLTINNNLNPLPAVGTFGPFDVSLGMFTVSGQLTAYFGDIAAVNAVRNNSEVTLDFHIVKENAGMSFDIPLISLGDGRVNVEQDQAIMLPLSIDATVATPVTSAYDHTFMMVFYDYLPTAADS